MAQHLRDQPPVASVNAQNTPSFVPRSDSSSARAAALCRTVRFVHVGKCASAERKHGASAERLQAAERDEHLDVGRQRTYERGAVPTSAGGGRSFDAHDEDAQRDPVADAPSAELG